jgi:hypothetical protein
VGSPSVSRTTEERSQRQEETFYPTECGDSRSAALSDRRTAIHWRDHTLRREKVRNRTANLKRAEPAGITNRLLTTSLHSIVDDFSRALASARDCRGLRGILRERRWRVGSRKSAADFHGPQTGRPCEPPAIWRPELRSHERADARARLGHISGWHLEPMRRRMRASVREFPV